MVARRAGSQESEVKSERSPFDIPAANECADCEGKGQTNGTRPAMRQTAAGWETTQQGSGCPRCLGTGRLSDE